MSIIHTTAPVLRRGVRRVVGAGVAAGLVGAAVLYGYGAVALALAGPMQAGDPWSAAPEPVEPVNFAMGTLVCTFWGTVLALALARRAARPARLFARVAAALVAASTVFPLAAVGATTATRVTLVLAHLVAAAIVVPALVHALKEA